MKVFLFFVFSILVFSCNNRDENKQENSENDVDAARNFIRSALDGRWEDARKYMIIDSTNEQLLDRSLSVYQGMGKEEKRSYRESTIRFYDSREVSDSITVIRYSNTYRNIQDSLKVVKQDGQWLVDLKYSLLASKFSNAD